VAPVFTPEAIAEHIVRAARDAPRELWIGGPAVQAILGNMAIPGLLDRMLATKAYGGQQADEPAQVRPDNLLAPPPGDPGMRGRFGAEARARVAAFDPALLRAGAAVAGLGLLGGAWLWGRMSAGRRVPVLRGRRNRWI
jgi:hypothetical protein